MARRLNELLRTLGRPSPKALMNAACKDNGTPVPEAPKPAAKPERYNQQWSWRNWHTRIPKPYDRRFGDFNAEDAQAYAALVDRISHLSSVLTNPYPTTVGIERATLEAASDEVKREFDRLCFAADKILGKYERVNPDQDCSIPGYFTDSDYFHRRTMASMYPARLTPQAEQEMSTR